MVACAPILGQKKSVPTSVSVPNACCSPQVHDDKLFSTESVQYSLMASPNFFALHKLMLMTTFSQALYGASDKFVLGEIGGRNPKNMADQ